MLVCVVALLGLSITSARAGGAPIEWDRSIYATGEIAHGTVGFGPGCCGRGTPADGPYYAYLLPFDNHTETPPMPAEAVQVGEVALDIYDEDSGIAQFDFTVPAVAPGMYVVIPCDDPCTTILGDVVGTGFEIVQNPAQADVLPLIKRLERRMKRQVSIVSDEVGKMTHLPAGYETLAGRVSELEARIEALEANRASGGDEQSTEVLSLVALGGLAAAGLFAWRRRAP